MTLEEALWQDPERMSGTICFRGTRIPVWILMDHLPNDIEDFREGFPDVSEEQIRAVLDHMRKFWETGAALPKLAA